MTFLTARNFQSIGQTVAGAAQRLNHLYETLRALFTVADTATAPTVTVVVNTTYIIPAGVRGFSIHNIDSPTCTVGGVAIPLGGSLSFWPGYSNKGLATQLSVITATAIKNVVVTIAH